jgi:hypothetical protein
MMMAFMNCDVTEAALSKGMQINISHLFFKCMMMAFMRCKVTEHELSNEKHTFSSPVRF